MLDSIDNLQKLREIFGIKAYEALQGLNRDHMEMVLTHLHCYNICGSPEYQDYLEECMEKGIVGEDLNIAQIEFDPATCNFTNQMLHALCALYLGCLRDDTRGLKFDMAGEANECPWEFPGPDYQYEAERV